MPTPTDEPSIYTQLRHKATTQLETGTTARTGQWSVGVDALRLLHRLSADPDHAGDALKLLHELQVHQVELDLQHEEMATNEQGLVDDLNLYRALFECAPCAYCLLDAEGCILQGNRVAAELFEVGKSHLEGQRIDSFLHPQSRLQVLGLIERAGQGGASDRCMAQMNDEQGSRTLQLEVTRLPESNQLLLVCFETGHEQSV